MNIKKIAAAALAAATLGVGMAACSSDADVVSENLSKAADNFEVVRRIVFYNGITGDYVLEVVGRCSIGNNDDPGKLSVTCKVGDDKFKKHYLGLSDNVTWFAEQVDGQHVSKDYYRVVFKPSVIVPDIDARAADGPVENQD